MAVFIHLVPLWPFVNVSDPRSSDKPPNQEQAKIAGRAAWQCNMMTKEPSVAILIIAILTAVGSQSGMPILSYQLIPAQAVVIPSCPVLSEG